MKTIDEKGKKIIEGANAVFMKYGIKSVSMDEVARQLSISKKTLYKYVKDKSDLLNSCCMMQAEQEDALIEEVMQKRLNAVDELFEIMHMVSGMLQEMHPSVIFDMQKYHPEVLEAMMSNRHTAINSCITANLEKGQKEGLYRTDFHPELVSHMYVTGIENCFHNAEGTPIEHIPITERYVEFFRYHMRGIASDKGLEYLKQKVKELEQN